MELYIVPLVITCCNSHIWADLEVRSRYCVLELMFNWELFVIPFLTDLSGLRADRLDSYEAVVEWYVPLAIVL